MLSSVICGMLAQAGPAGGDAPLSIWDLIVKGGPVMVPIAICSLVAIAVMVERSISLRMSSVIPAAFMPKLRDTMRRGSDADRRAALGLCRENASPMAGICAAAIRRLDEPIEYLERTIEQAGEREVFKLRRYLRVLSVVAAVAPLLGLLGTVFGMIGAFRTVAASGEALGRTELLANGIYEALITTAAGLIVAIPSLLGYHWFSTRVERLVAEMDRQTVDFIEEFAAGRGALHSAVVQSIVEPHGDGSPQDRRSVREGAAAAR